MNHLGSDSTMRVVFDAGDAKIDVGDEEDDDEEDDLDDDEKIPTVDISKLKSEFASDPFYIKHAHHSSLTISRCLHSRSQHS